MEVVWVWNVDQESSDRASERGSGRCRVPLGTSSNSLFSILAIQPSDLVYVYFQQQSEIWCCLCSIWTEISFNSSLSISSSDLFCRFISADKHICWKVFEELELQIHNLPLPSSLGPSFIDSNFSKGFLKKVDAQEIVLAEKVIVEIKLHDPNFIINEEQGNYYFRQVSQLLKNQVVKIGCFIGLYNNLIISQMSAKIQSAESTISSSSPCSLFRISSSTQIEVVYSSYSMNQEKSDTLETTKENTITSLMQGHSAVESLMEIIQYPFQYPQLFYQLGILPPKGILIKGPSGVGKTFLVQKLCSEFNVHLTHVRPIQIYGPYVGDSEKILKRLFEEAMNQKGPSVLFLDEIDILCPQRASSSAHESRIIAQLLTLMDGIKTRGDLIIVAATSRPNSIDPALRRPGRLDREIEITIPTLEERISILKYHTFSMPLTSSVDLKSISSLLPGFIGADIEALCREAAMCALKRIQNSSSGDKKIEVIESDFLEAIRFIKPSSQKGITVELTPTKWDSIGGLSCVKKKLQQAIEWPLKFPESFRRLGLTTPRGILLYGPPGCSKTTLVRAIASSLSVTFLSMNGASIYSKYFGDAEAAIRSIFKKARMGKPSVIFFDEIDAIVGKRTEDSTSEGVQERVLATLLNEMDGIEQAQDVIVIAATNRPDNIDTALLRPGRIDLTLYVPLPDYEARAEILQIHSKKIPLDKDVNLRDIALSTHNWSGAELENLCREAALFALRENLQSSLVAKRHFEEAKKMIQINKAVQSTSMDEEFYLKFQLLKVT